MTQKLLTVAILLTGALALGGCPKKNTTVQPPTAGTQVSSGSGAATSGYAAGGAAGGSSLDNGGNGSTGTGVGGINGGRNVVYFDFDKSEIKPEFADIIKSNAANLAAHPALKMKLEGNTDERGTREYNIGLGERRAQAVRRALMLQGVTESQLNTVSFGSERPAAEGDDEAAWAQNRRVELVTQP